MIKFMEMLMREIGQGNVSILKKIFIDEIIIGNDSSIGKRQKDLHFIWLYIFLHKNCVIDQIQINDGNIR